MKFYENLLQKMDTKDGENDICIQITCRYSSDNLINRQQQRFNQFSDLNDDDTKHPAIESQFAYTEEDSTDKIFHDTIEELNLARLYIEGYDVTIIKNGKRNIFYSEQQKQDANTTLKTEKSSTSSSTNSSLSNDDTDNDEDEDDDCEDSKGLVYNFIRTIFEDLVSIKGIHFFFSVGWTEINELNQLLDLLNGNGLVQCFSMPQLLETISVGLKNKNELNNHNILSIVLEQQWIDNINGLPVHKLSTVNFCDFKYANEKSLFTQPPPLPPPAIINEPINFHPYLPPYMLSPPPQLPHTSFFSMPPPLPPPDLNMFRSNFFDNANALLVQQNQRLLKNAEVLFSKLNINDIDEERRKEIQEWICMKNECDNYMSSTSTLGDLPPPPSYFHHQNTMNNNPLQQFQQQQQQQQSSLLPIIEMDENSTGRDEEDDNDSESGSYIDINDNSNHLLEKITDKITNFQQKADELVNEKNKEYFENNPKVIFSSGSDCKATTAAAVPFDNLLDEAVGGVCEENDLTKSSTTSEQYLATTGRRRSIRGDNNILNSDELNLIRKAAAATSFDLDSVKEGPENEQQTKLDDLRKSLKKSIA